MKRYETDLDILLESICVVCPMCKMPHRIEISAKELSERYTPLSTLLFRPIL